MYVIRKFNVYNNQMVSNNYYAQVLVFLSIACMGDVINRYSTSWLLGLKAMKKIGGELTQCLKLSSVKNKGE